MLAGHDFDALLMGSLYGELSAVEESRLQAHLLAHPGDQELWRSLLRTREVIRSSAALVVVEPPQAISARILQEAARRAPKTGGAIDGGLASRLGKWLATLAAHPALAAAAMAVVAIGVAGTMYARGRGDAASPKIAAPSASAPVADPPAAAEPPAPMAAAEPTATSGDSFAVGLANASAPTDDKLRQEGKADQDELERAGRRQVAQNEESGRGRKAAAKPAPKKGGYLQTSTAEYEVPLKDLEDEERKEESPADADFATAPPLVIAGERERTNAGPQQAKVPAAPAATRARVADGAPAPVTAGASAAPGAAAPSRQPVSAPSAAPAPAAPAEDDASVVGGAVDKVADSPRPDDKWAASEHARLVRLARANKCTEAAAVARSIAERAPQYYADRVTGDRELRACSSAIRDALNLRPDAKRKATRAGEADTRK